MKKGGKFAARLLRHATGLKFRERFELRSIHGRLCRRHVRRKALRVICGAAPRRPCAVEHRPRLPLSPWYAARRGDAGSLFGNPAAFAHDLEGYCPVSAGLAQPPSRDRNRASLSAPMLLCALFKSMRAATVKSDCPKPSFGAKDSKNFSPPFLRFLRRGNNEPSVFFIEHTASVRPHSSAARKPWR